MNLPTFIEYFNSCMFKHPDMDSVIEAEWNFNEDEVFIGFHSSYIDKSFTSKYLSKKIN